LALAYRAYAVTGGVLGPTACAVIDVHTLRTRCWL